jgi:hypothetical protein
MENLVRRGPQLRGSRRPSGLGYWVACFLLAFIGLGKGAAAEPASGGGLVGRVTQSAERKVGERFTFANIHSTRPFVTFPSGHGEHTTKVYEDDELVVLFFVGYLTGGTETFYLDKARHRFTLVEVGALEARARGTDIQPIVTFGNLE